MKNKCKEKLFKWAVFFEESHAFGAARQGLMLMIPLIVAGSVALMLKSLPIQAYQDVLPKLFGGKYLELLNCVYAGTFQFFAVVLALTTSVSYAIMEQRKENRSSMSECVMLCVVTMMSLAGYLGIQSGDFGADTFSTMHTFTAIFVALLGGYLYYKIKRCGIFLAKRMELDVDGNFVQAVQAIVPATLVVLFFGMVSLSLQLLFGIHSVQEGLEIVSETFLSYFHERFHVGIAMILLTHSVWFFGIHGSNMIEPVMQKHYVDISSSDVWNKSFQDVFVIMGGSGVMLSLLLAILIFAKKRNNRRIAKLACPSVLMNISEVLAFGIPVIYNPIFLIPFVLVPIVNHVICYAAIYFGLVPHVVKEVQWTTPFLLSGYQATGSVAGSVLQLVCVVVGMLIYRPFVRLFEEHQEMQMAKKVGLLVEELQRQEETNTIQSLTRRDDALGGVARMLAADLEEAIVGRKLFLVYQPQVDRQERCIGAEGLLRWIHPNYGFIYPPLIIRLAKELNMLSRLEEFILDSVAETIADIDREIGGEFKISVNITNESLEWEGFEQCIEDCVERHHIASEKLWLEITEQDALSSSITIEEKIHSLKEKGHQFLIDDFGMGHTSLTYLQTNYFGIVKLDGSLTRDVLGNERNCDIISSIVYLGQSLHFMIVAEYVETKEQRDKLAQVGVDAFQGYLYSKPLKVDELIPWMKEHRDRKG